ncbi:Stk1 family PASTA domain-containing Ser/Thr kinase [Nocardioides sp. KR10-350]|uniref:Stk1 family PASTA domain-containing Ser/Thr kinase n=1 Tax=Nocardioides cheoyonin TaxID=3156615 RepID=UPI0032B4FA81
MNQPEPSLIAGRYEVGELLGRGGMAEVRKGTDTRLGRTVAIKRLRTDLASDATFQARFRREAQSSASLNHPAIVAVYDTGEEKTAEGVAQPYIVMEYVAGRTLRDILREGRKILPERALEITSDVLSALDYSHRAGIIHRDIKPGNVMLTPAGDVKVMDFGIARAISDASSTMTQTAAVVGTAQYLSPEQARGETVDSRSDVYSAGCLLYELLTGRPPFVGDSPVAVAYQHVREMPTPPSDHDTALPPEVDAIVMKSLAKRVEDRYQSAAAMRNDIERYLAGRPVHAVVPPAPATVAGPATAATAVVPSAGGPGAPVPPPGEEDEERGPRTWLLVLLGLIVLALVAVGAFFMPKLFDDAPDRVEIPNVVGKTETQARKLIGNAQLEVSTTQQSSQTVKSGRVISQDPEGGQGAYADPGTIVTITVSTGLPDVTMPDVVGSSLKTARSLLTGDGYKFKVTVEPVDSDQPKNEVLETNPRAGTSVTSGPGTTVILTVSKGPQAVPNVIGKTQQQAEQILRNAGFVPRVTEDNSTKKPKGTVTDQSPKGSSQPQGTEVVIWVSTYEPLPTCPTSTSVVPDPTNPLASTTTTIPADPGNPPTCTPGPSPSESSSPSSSPTP